MAKRSLKHAASHRPHRTQQARGKEYTLKAIIFDLDDTLYDNLNQVGKKAMHTADITMAHFLKEDPEVIHNLRADLVQKGIRFFEQNPLICHELGVNKQLIDKASEIANNHYYVFPKVKGIKLFPGVPALLKKLRKKHKLALITFGVLEKQQEKIKVLKVAPYFDFVVNDYKIKLKQDKADSFLDVMEKFKLKAEEIAVVGDNPKNEIEVGNKLGMTTIRVLQGKFKDYAPKSDFERADFNVKKVTEVDGVLELL